MSRQWQVKQNDEVLGPFSDTQIKKLVATGRVHKKTPVRKEENSIWFMAGRFPELFADQTPARHEAVASVIRVDDAELDDIPKRDELWHVVRGGKTIGPFTRDQLVDRVRGGWLDPTDLVWKPGYDDWKPAQTIKGLFPDESRQINSSLPPLPNESKAIKKRIQFLSAEDFRYPGEATSLLIACGLLLLLITATTAATVGVVVGVIAVSVVVFKIQESSILARCSRVGPRNYPELYSLAELAANRLSIKLPAVYLQKDKSWNAFAIGFLGSPSVVLHTSLVEAFDQDELLFIIGHELAHVKCGHTSWLVFTNSSANVLRNPLFEIVALLLFKSWSRKSEFTCDRGGLLACRNPKAAVLALAKVELGPKRTNEEEVKKMLTEIRLVGDMVWNSADSILADHPLTEKRIHAIADFWRTDYKRLIEE